MENYRARVEAASGWIRERCDRPPKVGVILGTGLGGLAREIRDAQVLPYEEIPEFPVSTAPGHSGALHLGKLGETPVVAMEGRFHLYEGYDVREITFPVRVMARLGIEDLILSNACGGMNLELEKGDLVVLEDHINLMGVNPLMGENVDDWGPRFPDLSAPYDRGLIDRILEIARAEKIRARPGVYVAVPGPNLETPAEYRMLRGMGPDVVGMSTVPEVLVAIHEGLRTAAISIVTDICDPDHLQPVVVEEILQVAADAEPRLTRVVKLLIEGSARDR